MATTLATTHMTAGKSNTDALIPFPLKQTAANIEATPVFLPRAPCYLVPVGIPSPPHFIARGIRQQVDMRVELQAVVQVSRGNSGSNESRLNVNDPAVKSACSLTGPHSDSKSQLMRDGARAVSGRRLADISITWL
ncbi:MAG: hypothetical protein WBM81_19630, partial [Sedimenticolaceae bacterium]